VHKATAVRDAAQVQVIEAEIDQLAKELLRLSQQEMEDLR